MFTISAAPYTAQIASMRTAQKMLLMITIIIYNAFVYAYASLSRYISHLILISITITITITDDRR